MSILNLLKGDVEADLPLNVVRSVGKLTYVNTPTPGQMPAAIDSEHMEFQPPPTGGGAPAGIGLEGAWQAKVARAVGTKYKPNATKSALVNLQVVCKAATLVEFDLKIEGVTVGHVVVPPISVASEAIPNTTNLYGFFIERNQEWQLVETTTGGIIELLSSYCILSGTTGGGGSGGPPTGVAGGVLAGTYPNPTLAASSVDSTAIAAGAVSEAKVEAGLVERFLPAWSKKVFNELDQIVVNKVVYSAKDNHDATGSASFAADQAAHWIKLGSASGGGSVNPEAVVQLWKPNATYGLNEQAMHESKLYTASKAHSGVATFNLANWTLVGPASALGTNIDVTNTFPFYGSILLGSRIIKEVKYNPGLKVGDEVFGNNKNPLWPTGTTILAITPQIITETTAKVTANSTKVTGLVAGNVLGSFYVGMPVSNPTANRILAGTTVAEINSPTEITLSNVAKVFTGTDTLVFNTQVSEVEVAANPSEGSNAWTIFECRQKATARAALEIFEGGIGNPKSVVSDEPIGGRTRISVVDEKYYLGNQGILAEGEERLQPGSTTVYETGTEDQAAKIRAILRPFLLKGGLVQNRAFEFVLPRGHTRVESQTEDYVKSVKSTVEKETVRRVLAAVHLPPNCSLVGATKHKSESGFYAKKLAPTVYGSQLMQTENRETITQKEMGSYILNVQNGVSPNWGSCFVCYGEGTAPDRESLSQPGIWGLVSKMEGTITPGSNILKMTKAPNIEARATQVFGPAIPVGAVVEGTQGVGNKDIIMGDGFGNPVNAGGTAVQVGAEITLEGTISSVLYDGILVGGGKSAYEVETQHCRYGFTFTKDHHVLNRCTFGGWAGVGYPEARSTVGSIEYVNCVMGGAWCNVFVEPGALCVGEQFIGSDFGFCNGAMFYAREAAKPGEGFVNGCVFEGCYIEEPGGFIKDDTRSRSVTNNKFTHTHSPVGTLGRMKGDPASPNLAWVECGKFSNNQFNDSEVMCAMGNGEGSCMIRADEECCENELGPINIPLLAAMTGKPLIRSPKQENNQGIWSNGKQNIVVSIKSTRNGANAYDLMQKVPQNAPLPVQSFSEKYAGVNAPVDGIALAPSPPSKHLFEADFVVATSQLTNIKKVGATVNSVEQLEERAEVISAGIPNGVIVGRIYPSEAKCDLILKASGEPIEITTAGTKKQCEILWNTVVPVAFLPNRSPTLIPVKVTQMGEGRREGQWPPPVPRGAKAVLAADFQMGEGRDLPSITHITKFNEKEPGLRLPLSTLSDLPSSGYGSVGPTFFKYVGAEFIPGVASRLTVALVSGATTVTVAQNQIFQREGILSISGKFLPFKYKTGTNILVLRSAYTEATIPVGTVVAEVAGTETVILKEVEGRPSTAKAKAPVKRACVVERTAAQTAAGEPVFGNAPQLATQFIGEGTKSSATVTGCMLWPSEVAVINGGSNPVAVNNQLSGGFPEGTFVEAVTATTVTLKTEGNTGFTGGGNFDIQGEWASGSLTITNITTPKGIAGNKALKAVGLAAGTEMVSYNSTTKQMTLNKPTTAASAGLKAVKTYNIFRANHCNGTWYEETYLKTKSIVCEAEEGNPVVKIIQQQNESSVAAYRELLVRGEDGTPGTVVTDSRGAPPIGIIPAGTEVVWFPVKVIEQKAQKTLELSAAPTATETITLNATTEAPVSENTEGAVPTIRLKKAGGAITLGTMPAIYEGVGLLTGTSNGIIYGITSSPPAGTIYTAKKGDIITDELFVEAVGRDFPLEKATVSSARTHIKYDKALRVRGSYIFMGNISASGPGGIGGVTGGTYLTAALTIAAGGEGTAQVQSAKGMPTSGFIMIEEKKASYEGINTATPGAHKLEKVKLEVGSASFSAVPINTPVVIDIFGMYLKAGDRVQPAYRTGHIAEGDKGVVAKQILPSEGDYLGVAVVDDGGSVSEIET